MQKFKESKVYRLVLVAEFAAIITICSWISIPTTVPFTLQTFAVFVAAGLLGWKYGTISIVVYILLGAVGIPVFAGFSGGIGAIIGPTGGYIIGFIFTSLIVGLITKFFGKKIYVLIISMILGLAVCYLFGTLWFMFVSQMGFIESLMLCVVPFLIFDACKIVAASIIVRLLYERI